MSFETEVQLGINVDDGSLQSAKRAIEDELGDVTVGVSGGGAASRASSAGGAGAGGQQSRRLFRWARERTGYMEETVELLTSIEEKVGGGGGGGLFGGALAARGALSFGGAAAGGAAGAGLAGAAKRWGGRAAAGLAATLSTTTLTVAGIAVSSLVASEIIGRSMVTNPPTMQEIPPWARAQIAEGQGTTTQSAGRAGGVTSSEASQIASAAAELRQVTESLSQGGPGRGPTGQVDVNVSGEVETNVDLSTELNNLKDETIREIEDRIENSIGGGRVR